MPAADHAVLILIRSAFITAVRMTEIKRRPLASIKRGRFQRVHIGELSAVVNGDRFEDLAEILAEVPFDLVKRFDGAFFCPIRHFLDDFFPRLSFGQHKKGVL